MPNVVVVGAQWGDEGKGKVVDLLAPRVQAVARYNGGHNAGHTIIVRGRKYVLRMIPSGVLHEGLLNVMGNGMVIDPWALEQEIAELLAGGLSVAGSLIISDRATLILPHHRALEAIAEKRRQIGTTGRGIGPAYEDKAGRRAIRMADLLRPESLHAKLEPARAHYEAICRGVGESPSVDWDALVVDLGGFGQRLGGMLRDVSLVLHDHMAHGYSILFEGAQSTLLDIDHGTYPFVTSSTCIAGGAVAGLGVPLTRIDGVVGVMKAYTTRVGAGPLPSEIGGEREEALRQRGQEFGAVTGRPRRCGWFDAVATRYSVRVNGFDSLALVKLDVLDDLEEIPVCTGYTCDGEPVSEFPADMALLQRCQPVVETLPGWRSSTVGLRDYESLPWNAQRYIERLTELVGGEIGIVSTGPDREQTLIRPRSRVAGWFE